MSSRSLLALTSRDTKIAWNSGEPFMKKLGCHQDG